MRISDWSSDVCSSDLPRGELRCEIAHVARLAVDNQVDVAQQHHRRLVGQAHEAAPVDQQHAGAHAAMIRPLTSLRLATSAARRLATAWDSRICRPSRLLYGGMANRLTAKDSNQVPGRAGGGHRGRFARNS